MRDRAPAVNDSDSLYVARVWPSAENVACPKPPSESISLNRVLFGTSQTQTALSKVKLTTVDRVLPSGQKCSAEIPIIPFFVSVCTDWPVAIDNTWTADPSALARNFPSGE